MESNPDITTDPKLKKKFEKFLAKEATKLSAKEEKEIKVLRRKALQLWKTKIKILANNECEACGKKKRLQIHHIESYATNKSLRYDIHNGVCLCTTCHKFGRQSAHHSFCFMFNLMTGPRNVSLTYLLRHYKDKIEITKNFLKQTIDNLTHSIPLRKKQNEQE